MHLSSTDERTKREAKRIQDPLIEWEKYGDTMPCVEVVDSKQCSSNACMPLIKNKR